MLETAVSTITAV